MTTSVKLRERQQSADGKISLYLEYYKGTCREAGGKIVAVRDYEVLKLYLRAKPKNRSEKDENKKILELAEKIRIRRQDEINTGKWGFESKRKKTVKVFDYFQDFATKRKDSYRVYILLRSLVAHLKIYCNDAYGREVGFADIDIRFCENFKTYFTTQAKTIRNKQMASGTAHNYFQRFKSILNQAVEDEVIPKSPATSISLPKKGNNKREYLTVKELQALADTPCSYDEIKRAFLFSCLTGLRWSDIEKMVWGEVQNFGDGWRIIFQQKKTRGLLYHDIQQQAVHLLGERGNHDKRVFLKLRYNSDMLKILQKWVHNAGIAKKITFHCGRHTYAVVQLEHGTDILTLSKMLGHSTITTTMVYSQVMDQKRIDAANRIPLLNLWRV